MRKHRRRLSQHLTTFSSWLSCLGITTAATDKDKKDSIIDDTQFFCYKLRNPSGATFPWSADTYQCQDDFFVNIPLGLHAVEEQITESQDDGYHVFNANITSSHKNSDAVSDSNKHLLQNNYYHSDINRTTDLLKAPQLRRLSCNSTATSIETQRQSKYLACSKTTFSNASRVSSSAQVRTEQITIVLQRDDFRGFGFTLTGSNPVRVGRVDPLSVAGHMGVQPGDIVVTVDGQFVLAASCDYVIRLIRNSSARLELGLQRCVEMLQSSLKASPSKASQRECSMLASPYSCNMVATKAALNQQSNHHRTCSLLAEIQPETTASVNSSSKAAMFGKSMANFERMRQASVCKVISREEVFVDCMQRGLVEFAEPLREILCSDECDALFGNMFALIEMSRSCTKNLLASVLPRYDGYKRDQRLVDNPGQIYKRSIYLLCDEYRRYSEDLSEHGLLVLQDLRYNRIFQEFLQRPSSQPDLPSLYVFLLLPFEHLRGLTKDLSHVFSYTSDTHYDHLYLDDVVQCLESCCQDFPARLDFTANANSPPPLASHEDRFEVDSGIITQTFPFNTEMMHLQSRLQFLNNVKSFNVAQSNRQLIYSGDLLWQNEGCQSALLKFVILFSDMLLITQREPNDCITVIQDPFVLEECTAYDFEECGGRAELRFHLCFGIYRMARFEAFNQEELSIWKRFVTERINVCRAVDFI